LGTEQRLRDKQHLRFIAARACLICSSTPTHAHHVTFAQRRGLSIKVSDEFTVPLCAVHHDECHRSGNERQWWSRHSIDPLTVAASLWRDSHDASPPQSSSLGFSSGPTSLDTAPQPDAQRKADSAQQNSGASGERQAAQL